MTSNLDDLCFVNSSRFYQFLLIKIQIVCGLYCSNKQDTLYFLIIHFDFLSFILDNLILIEG
jgi:hypothetical protein